MRKVKLANVYENEELKKEYSYPKGWRFEMMEPLRIKVYAPYEIAEINGEKHIISSHFKERCEKKKISTAFGTSSHEFNPFDNGDLFLEALKINTENETNILNFCNRYGLLGEIRSKRGNRGGGGYLINHNDTGYMESLEYFTKQIKEFKRLFHLYLITKNKDKKDLLQYWNDINLEALKDAETKEYEELLKQINESIKNPPPTEEILDNALANLISDVNDNLTEVFLSLRIKGNIKQFDFIEGMTSSTLKGVLYYQLYNHLVKGNDFKKCKYCGDYFQPRKTDARFCPSDLPNEHGKCQNRYNAMVRRAREWHFKQGLSPEEIHEKIKKPTSRNLIEIQHWLNTYKGKIK